MNKEILCKFLLECKDEILVFYQFYIFGINFNNDCASGYSFFNQAVCPK